MHSSSRTKAGLQDLSLKPQKVFEPGKKSFIQISLCLSKLLRHFYPYSILQ